MIMAPVSLPPCQAHVVAADAVNPEAYLNKKRASIHYPDDSTAAKRMSLHFGARCRSLSESWAFSSASAVLPEFPEKKDGSSPSSPSSPSHLTIPSPNLPPISSTTLSKASQSASSSKTQQEQPDQELLKTLASFLRGEGNAAEDDVIAQDRKTIKAKRTSGLSLSAGPTSEESTTTCNLVVTVRDFAYPKTHPYHLGIYPPTPEYKESDVEDDEEDMEYEDTQDYDEHDGEDRDDGEDRTQGHARGLYDFDAENSSELSFREGEVVYIHCRQFPGWFLGEMDGRTGLVPENYVELI